MLGALALRERGLRVVVVDVDAHHRNGTQAAFEDDPDVLAVSLHESGASLYPGIGWAHELGHGAARGTTVNLPLPVDMDDRAATCWTCASRPPGPSVSAFGTSSPRS